MQLLLRASAIIAECRVPAIHLDQLVCLPNVRINLETQLLRNCISATTENARHILANKLIPEFVTHTYLHVGNVAESLFHYNFGSIGVRTRALISNDAGPCMFE